MIRGFLSGAIWGSAVAALGLGAVSQLTPLPVERIAADASAVPRAKPVPEQPAPAEPVQAEPVPTVPLAQQKDVAPAVAAPQNDAPAPAPAAEPTPAAKPASPVAVPVTEALDPPAGSEFGKPLPDVEPVAPAADLAPAPGAGAAAPLALPPADAATLSPAPATAPVAGLEAPEPLETPQDSAEAGALAAADDGTQIALAPPAQIALPQADAAPAPAQNPAPPTTPEADDVLLKPLPKILPVPDAPAKPSAQRLPDPVLGPDTDPAAEAAGKPSATLDPTPGLDGMVDGVTTGRLPRIGDAEPVPESEAVPATKANPDGSPVLEIDGEADQPPLQKYARAFENPDAKPLFSIILIDTGGADLDRAALAALPFPVTFALDPLAPNVAQASAIYRGGGQEVIMVATGIPTGATAADLEVTFQAHATALPEAVAVIDTEFGAFQSDRPMATQVVPILKAQGRGLISWDRGLNAADQVARREGLAAGMVFRKLDDNGENKSAVRRALDRAAFKAAQDGRVMVIGQTLPDTIAALMEWTVEGRATSVALAPVSAVLTTQ